MATDAYVSSWGGAERRMKFVLIYRFVGSGCLSLNCGGGDERW